MLVQLNFSSSFFDLYQIYYLLFYDDGTQTYSGTTPIQLSRSKIMSKFLQGFYSDISTDHSMIDRSNVWKFNSHHSLG